VKEIGRSPVCYITPHSGRRVISAGKIREFNNFLLDIRDFTFGDLGALIVPAILFNIRDFTFSTGNRRNGGDLQKK
jgi:hypothetical protein